MVGARLVARRAALFAWKRGAIVGWACSSGFGDPSALSALSITPDARSVFARVLSEGTYVGPLDPSADRALFDVMRSATREVAVVPIRLHARPALILLADELSDPAVAVKRLEELASASSEALLRILRAKK